MKTVKDVNPYRVKYRIWDTVTDCIEFESDDFDELCAVYYANYTARTYYEPHITKDHLYAYGKITPVYRFAIKTEFGDVIDNEDLPRARRNWNFCERRAKKKQDVRYKKGNPDKIKRGYYCYGWWWEDRDYYEFPYIAYGSYRRIRTMNEKRQNAYHVDDYGDSAVRGRRRGHNLPDSWDDPMSGVHYTIKSWKHHSKRRKQWKQKV